MPATAPEGPDAGARAIDVVIDTNVWLDLLVFKDTEVAWLTQALACGEVRAHVDVFSLEELRRVLNYPLGKRRLDEAAQADALTACRVAAVEFAPAEGPTRERALPVCRDRFDQPFLELAFDCGAACLITKDRDLLLLARRDRHRLPFQIATPTAAQWLIGSFKSCASPAHRDQACA